MLSYIEGLGDNKELSLKLLTWKLAMLLALVLAHRSSDLARLSLQGRRYLTNGASLLPKGLAKQSRPGRDNGLQPVFIPSLPGKEVLCPVACLRSYECATSGFRQHSQEDRLFLAVISPHKPVTSSSIARWLKQVLQLSGVDTSVFSAHSTRGASATAAAMAGMSVQDVLDRVDWSSTSTFHRFYYKPTSKELALSKYGKTVLAGL